MSEVPVPIRTLGVVADHGDVGLGHLGRSLAAIQQWTAVGGSATFYTSAPLPDGWPDRLAQAKAVVAPAEDLGTSKADAWLLDGYRFELELQSRLRAMGVLAVVDDHGTIGHYDADLIIDQNIGASAEDYPGRGDDVELLLGPSFALLRREIVDASLHAPRDRSRQPRRLLVALGGEPSDDLRALAAPLLVDAARWGLEVDLLDGVADVSHALLAADLAFSAAGSTCWELCALGVPAVIVAVATNQQPIARRLGELGAALDAGDLGSTTSTAITNALRSLVDDPAMREHQCRLGRTLVDAQGSARVVSAIHARVDRA